MNTQINEMPTVEVDSETVIMSQQELLDLTRQLDHMGKRFERFMSMQLQQLEIAFDDFDREREAWRRHREREGNEIEGRSRIAPEVISDHFLEEVGVSSRKDEKSYVPSNDATAPLRMLIRPGKATAMQIGLLLFEISKFNRELRGGGVRIDVSGTRISRKSAKKASANNESILSFEAFSYVPLLAYDGTPTQQLKSWDQFKSEILLSSLIDQKLQKEFKKFVETKRDHPSRELAFEATRRAENANSKCDITQERSTRGFFSSKKNKYPANQQLQRVEDVVRFLKKECDLRIHLALVW